MVFRLVHASTPVRLVQRKLGALGTVPLAIRRPVMALEARAAVTRIWDVHGVMGHALIIRLATVVLEAFWDRAGARLILDATGIRGTLLRCASLITAHNLMSR